MSLAASAEPVGDRSLAAGEACATMPAMETNDRARKVVAADLAPGEQILATVAMGPNLGAASTVTSAAQGGTVFAGAYARARGIDYADRRLRADLVASWCTVTPDRLVFHAPNQLAIRPKPGKLIEAMPRDGVELAWFDTSGPSLSNRVLHLQLPDGRHVLSATLLKATLRRKRYNDEPELFVEAFGPAARQVEDA